MGTTVRDNPDQDRYEIVVDGEVAGFCAYRLDDGRITFTHTEVGDAHAGQGLGKQLVTQLLTDVEDRGLAVVPQCSYVRKVLAEDEPRYLDLVPAATREALGLPSGGA